MTNKEKNILKKAVESNEGQISPATMINSYAGGDQGAVERLVSSGYLERVYQLHEGLHGATYSIIFYAVTEKGVVYFSPLYKRIWHSFTSQTAIYVGVAAIFFGLISAFTSWQAVSIAYRTESRGVLHDAISNKPHLQIAFFFNEDGAGYKIRSDGMGPAIEKWGSVRVDGQYMGSWDEVIKALNFPTEQPGGYRFTNFGADTMLPPNGDVGDIFWLPIDSHPKNIRHLIENFGRVRIDICYCSVYEKLSPEQCWQTSNHDAGMRSGCDAKPITVFLQSVPQFK